MARITGVSANEWLQHVNKINPVMAQALMKSATGPIQNPANAAAVGDYAAKAAAAASNSSNPGSIFEGMQTIADLSRTHAHYNPLDPTGTGNKEHFTNFTQNIADAPMLSLLHASTKNVDQKSQNSDALIDSFVSAFEGIAQENVAAITSAVANLAKAALSYSDKVQKYSNFAQNLLQTNSSGNVEFHLYSSQFEIHQTKSKGTVTFQANYEVLCAVYQLSAASWNQVKAEFNKQKKTDTNSWMNSMKTPVNAAGGSARALCLYR